MTRLIRVLAHLPLPLLYLIADLVFLVAFYLLRFQRELVTDNVGKAFPDLPPARVHAIAARSYRNIVHVVFETIKSLTLTEFDLRQRVDIENPSLIEELLKQHGTVLTVAGHQGNWEWLQLACAAELQLPLAALYKPMNRAAIDDLLYQLRTRFGSLLLAAQTALPELLKFCKQPGVIALVADQGPRPDEEKHWSRFLGRDTAFFPGPEKLARLFRAPLVFVHMQRLQRGRYRVRFELIAAPPYDQQQGEIMQLYIEAVEKQIREAPRDWAWIYKRWKYERSVYE